MLGKSLSSKNSYLFSNPRLGLGGASSAGKPLDFRPADAKLRINGNVVHS